MFDGFIDFEDIFENAEEARAEFDRSELVIAEGCRYCLNDMQTHLNNNVLVVGGSGTGKTRTIVTPNIHQAAGSYIISDPKGNLHKKYGRYLERHGYDIGVIDFTHPEKSARYNPMKDIRTSQDILKMAAILVNEKATENTRGEPLLGFHDHNSYFGYYRLHDRDRL